LVNDERASAGVGPLAWCDGLYACAKAHSNDMCDRGFFDHTNPDGEGPSARAQLGHAGSYTFQSIIPSPYGSIAENIAMSQTTAAGVMSAWMGSSGHRRNILHGGYTHIGVGLCNGCKTHWTQNFGSR
ncbi:MAG: CAP domain-containing protein, partial [Planctomycetota bacterium]